jgi:hypothetical protein
MLSTQIGHITLFDLLFLLVAFPVSGLAVRRIMLRREAGQKFARRLMWTWGVYVVAYITTTVVLGATDALILTFMYLAFCVGSGISYQWGRQDEMKAPDEMVEFVQEQLKRDWPKVVSIEAARAARDN